MYWFNSRVFIPHHVASYKVTIKLQIWSPDYPTMYMCHNDQIEGSTFKLSTFTHFLTHCQCIKANVPLKCFELLFLLPEPLNVKNNTLQKGTCDHNNIFIVTHNFMKSSVLNTFSLSPKTLITTECASSHLLLQLNAQNVSSITIVT